MEITHINPASMHANPAFSQGVLVSGAHRTLYIGGQDGVDSSGEIVEGGVAAQTAQALKNLLTVLADQGADQSNVVKMTVYLRAGEDVNAAFGASAEVWGQHATAITVVLVAALGREFLVEIDAVAVLPE